MRKIVLPLLAVMLCYCASAQEKVNVTYSPDSSRMAYTVANDLYVCNADGSGEIKLTSDGSEVILNGYASWVYYEEIFGRPSKYRAFWWSDDSRKIAFYRFDNSCVPMFPIYSPFGQDGKLSRTRYPKAGENNPQVRIGIIDLDAPERTVWADFNDRDDQYFGTPFWGKDSKYLYVSRMPRIQNTLDLYRVSAGDGSKSSIYHETYKTWIDWIEGMLFTDEGLYMARSFETGWEQIYFLSYDGKVFKRLTDGPNWRISLVACDGGRGEVFFTANRDSDTRTTLYRLDRKGQITALTDTALSVQSVDMASDLKSCIVKLSNYTTPEQEWYLDLKKPSRSRLLKDSAAEGFNPDSAACPKDIRITLGDSLVVPGFIVYPKNFDPSLKYPVHMEIYGGPNTAYVKDKWYGTEKFRWWYENGIIHVTVDVRASGHNGRAGTDLDFKDLTTTPVADALSWAEYLKTLTYVDGARIGIEGFSFGGTMTSLLLILHSDVFKCGIAGGGVYDWALYDTHYTERFMMTPQTNPEGYAAARVLNYVDKAPKELNLKLTHGTGDDNVHFQNTLQLVDALQSNGVLFELMVYPDGMHGYRGKQGAHSTASDREFWTRYLLK